MIVFSAVRSNSGREVGFLSDQRRLNVAITRAKRGLVVVGDAATLRGDATWSRWLDWAGREGALMGPGAERKLTSAGVGAAAAAAAREAAAREAAAGGWDGRGEISRQEL